MSEYEIDEVIKNIQKEFTDKPIPNKFYIQLTFEQYKSFGRILGFSEEEIETKVKELLGEQG